MGHWKVSGSISRIDCAKKYHGHCLHHLEGLILLMMPCATCFLLKNGNRFAAGSDTPVKLLFQAVNKSTNAYITDSSWTSEDVMMGKQYSDPIKNSKWQKEIGLLP